MKRINLLSINPISESSGLLTQSRGSFEWRVPGVVLEDQFLLEDGRIIAITSNNCPYEESLHILLLTTGHKQFERVDLEMPLTPGIYSAGHIVAGNAVDFQFFNKEDYRIEVLEKPSLRIFNPGAGIKYRSLLQRKSLSVTHLEKTMDGEA